LSFIIIIIIIIKRLSHLCRDILPTFRMLRSKIRLNFALDTSQLAIQKTSFTSSIAQSTLSKHLKEVSHPDSSQSHQAHLTVLQ